MRVVQQGHRGSRRAKATRESLRMGGDGLSDVALGTERRRRGVGNLLGRRGALKSGAGGKAQGGIKTPLGDQESVSGDGERGVVVEAAPAATLVVSEADFLLELLVVAFDAPSELGPVDEARPSRCLLRQGGEPIFGRLAVALWPFDEAPFLGPRGGAPVIAMRRPGRGRRWEARGERRVSARAPGDAVPSLHRQSLRQLLGRGRLVPAGWRRTSEGGRPRPLHGLAGSGAAPCAQTEVFDRIAAT